MRTIIKLSMVLFSLMISQVGYGQTEVIDLWPNGIQNQYEGLSGEKIEENQGTIIHVGEVTKPTLTIYPAQNSQGKKSKAVVICPGGGYAYLAIEKEGHVIARFLAKNGIAAVVLKYRLPNDSMQPNKKLAPVQDARQAIRMIRANAEKWNIDPNNIGIMGFSAGGHLAATASTRRPYFDVEGENLRPDFSLLIYPVISMKENLTHRGSRENLLGKTPSEELVNEFSNEMQVSTQTPPTFLVHALDDGAVPVENTLNYLARLRENKIPCEVHLYKSGGHGFGLNPGLTDSWGTLMLNWINSL